MKITDLQVDGFGIWKGLTVESLADDITIFCGQNEAGKTTLMQFIRSMLFGFSEERREKYIPPVYGGLAGGSLEIDSPIGQFEVQRHVDPNRLSDPVGDLAVTNMQDGVVHGRGQLSSLISDIDESIFNNVFAIGLREIQELGALNSTDAAEHLYKLTSGLDRVSLIDVMRDQKQRREAIWSTQPKNESRLAQLNQRRMELLREVDDLQNRSKRWSRIAAQTTDVSNQLEDINGELAKLEREARLVEVSMQISDRWQNRRNLTDQINSFGKLPDPRDISVEQLDKLNERISQQRERIDQIKFQRRNIKKEALELPINRQLWAEKTRIEAIAEHSPWVESLQRQANRLSNEVDSLENSLVGEVDGLGTQLKIRTKDVKDLGNRGLSGLKTTAKKVLEQRDRLKRLKQELDKTGFELGQHEERLGDSLSDDGAAGTLEETSRYVNRLRRRIELGEKIEKLNRSRSELERDIDDVVNDQVLPVGKLSIIGVVFIMGVILFGFGLMDLFTQASQFGRAAQDVGALLMLMGLVCGFISAGLKYHWERVAKDELDDFQHQIDIIRQQLKRAKAERDEIERQLPESVSQWDLELKDAESRLSRIEDLVPLENRLHNTRANLEELRRRIVAQEQEVEQIEDVWRAALRTAGLPDALEPLQLREITQRSSRITGFHTRLDQYQHELAERNKELDALRKRTDVLFNDVGLEFESEDLLERLNQLTHALHEQRSLVNTRKEFANKYRALRSKLAKSQRELEKLLGQKRRLLSKVGADNENDYRQFDVKHKQRNKLVGQRNSLTEQINAALGASFEEDELREYLDAYGITGLEKRWEAIQAEIDRVKEQQTKLHQQRGEFLQEVKMLGEDSRLCEARLELNAIDAEIANLKKQWQVLATSTKMLETIRESYESKRQPETLKEASTYLERLTEGHYTRIWTRLVGEELLVDNLNDETITVDKLSRGTREAVYLSLRLALVGAYARRGAVLPMVLDDVLVNFDSRRARQAAELLCEFSRNGYQILMFTCHEHMADLFHSLNAEVKLLPNHREVFDSQATVTDYAKPNVVPMNNVEIVDSLPVADPVFESNVTLKTDEYDPELEYELSAIVDDQKIEHRLRHELVYISPNFDSPIDISGNEDFWNESNAPVIGG